jgi:hypothetical protein
MAKEKNKSQNGTGLDPNSEITDTDLQGFQYFSSPPVLHYLQAILFFLLILNNFLEYLIQRSLKSGGIKDHFKWVKVHVATSY